MIKFLRNKRIKNYFLKEGGFGLTETILSMVMLSFITTYALYFVSLRQTNLFNANLNNAINDEIRRDIEKLKSELWTQHYNAPKGNMSAFYSTGISSSQPTYFCKNVLRTFFQLPSWRNREWTPGSNSSTYSGQKRNKIFSGQLVKIERNVNSQRPFNLGNDSQMDRSIAEVTYFVTFNNKKTQWTSIQLSSEAHSWCPPSSK
ncbi:hypothetical protein N9U76_01960 [Prochlorococcus sp. AH-736-L19]|nr:hypothetical protein [Prochlorococcus sp. AH-736-L19]MDA9704183.1 hypothetical protein [Prochlorococcus sp. AH-736-L19]